MINMANKATHSVLVHPKKAAGPGPFGLKTVESYSTHKSVCFLWHELTNLTAPNI